MNNTAIPKMISHQTFLWQTRTCAINGYLEKLNNHLTNSQCQHLVTQDLLNKCLVCACESGQLDIIKYLLHSKDLSIHADLKYHNHEAFRTLCTKQYTQCLEYLLTSSEVQAYAHIHNIKNNMLQIIFNSNNMQLFDHLLTSPQLNNKFSNLHEHDDYIFQEALSNKNLNFIKTLIFEYHLQKTTKITDYLYDYVAVNEDYSIVGKINDLFEKRDLYTKLNEQEIDLKNKNNRKKIKI